MRYEKLWNLTEELTEKYKDKIEKQFNILKTPFYAWECVTLKLANRTIDFVIKDESLLMMFI